MDNRILGIIALVGGIFAIVGFFGTWQWGVSSSPSPLEASSSISISGLDIAQGIKMTYLVLVGGVITIVGSVIGLIKPRWITKVLLATGGILILIGGADGFLYLWPQSTSLFSGSLIQYGAGYGAYLVAIGGILSILMTLGLEEKKGKRQARFLSSFR